ncbi:trypsin-like peptidase domain-containing protein, partial [Streptomyces sp. NPDC094038]|uniref:trypsin-like peptidase domain-containing protein n=1 Tax=Streptomyces sp. NPDC094038 TaxID=3366055 RepID=UPI00381A94C2
MTVDGHLPGDPAGLQAITAATAGLIESSALIRVIDDATRRVAMIEVDGQAAGTGVLVGQDLLLTAAHVVRGTRQAAARGSLVARFDFVAGAETAPFETGVRVPVLQILASSPPSDEEEAGSAVTWEVPANRLDYAMLRLESPPPDSAVGTVRPRGQYMLQEEDYDFGTPGIVFIVQHPLRMPQTISYTTGPLQINEARTRIRYRNVNTAAGSSGSPVIDAQGRLLGIHHYAARGVNQGVPASAIARAVRLAAPAHLVRALRSPVEEEPTASLATKSAPTHGAGRQSRLSSAVPVHVLRGHTGPVSAVSVACVNGRQMVVSAGFDQSVRAWDLSTGEAWAKFEGHQNLVYTTDCTDVGDDAVALSGGEGPRIRVWRLASRQESKPITANAMAINALCCVQVLGHAVVVVGTTEGGVEVWDLASRRKVTEFRGHTAAVSAVACATVEGRPVAITGSRDETIRLW